MDPGSWPGVMKGGGGAGIATVKKSDKKYNRAKDDKFI
jgi:hypothetical protein